jgi:hypothetical protein
MKPTRLLVLGLTVFAGACASPRKAVVSGAAGVPVPVARVETVVAGGLRTPEEVAAYNRVVGETMTALVESGACPGPGSIERFLTSKSKSCSMLGSTILIAFITTNRIIWNIIF